jgi:DNA-binding HxlR family transcriptional regulator
MSLVQEEMTCRPEICSLVRGIKRAGSPWNLIVAAYLLDRPLRFNEILRLGKADELNARTLSRVLRNMAEEGLVKRKVVNIQPFAV